MLEKQIQAEGAQLREFWEEEEAERVSLGSSFFYVVSLCVIRLKKIQWSLFHNMFLYVIF
jgi:hypothetical protein